MKKTLAIMLAILMIVTSVPIAFAAEGETKYLYLKISDGYMTMAMTPDLYVRDDAGNEIKYDDEEYVGDDTYSYKIPADIELIYWDYHVGGGSTDDDGGLPFFELPDGVDTYYHDENRWYCLHQNGASIVEDEEAYKCEICGEKFRSIYLDWDFGWHTGSVDIGFCDSMGNELPYLFESIEDNFDLYRVSVDAVSYCFDFSLDGTHEGTIPEKVDYYEADTKTWYCSHNMNTSGEQTCKGYLCEICDEFYGEASDHSYGEDDICIYCGDFLVLDGAPSTQTIDGKTFYELDSAADLYWFAEQVNVYGNKGINGILTADIVLNKDLMSKITIAEDGTATVKDGKTVRSWTPICKYINSDRNGYSGIFDGANHTVSGVYVNDSNGDYISFFGLVEGATIKNLGITDSYFRAKYKCASFSGNAYSATITNCFSEDCFVSGSYKAGGLIAYLSNSTLTGCYNASEVRCSGGSDAGGLTGEVGGKSIIRDCFNTGDVYGKGSVYKTGGISGISSNPDVIVENCYNIGKINGEDKVGGILGKNNGTAINCYNHTGFFAGNAIGSFGEKAVEISVEGKNAQQFASGEVTHALGSAWGQKLGEDLYPVLGSADKVYRISEYETCGQTDEPVVEYTNEGDSDVTYAPSHDLYGETICLGQLCSVCGKYGGTPDNDKHSMIWKTAKETTCYDEGLKISYCEFCGIEPAVSTVLCDESTYPESEHNYSANLDKEFTFSNENTIKLTLKFSEMTQTEKNADFIYIYDGKGNQLGKYSGKELSEKEFEIEGGSFKIKLTSDHGLQYYGFKLDYVYATVADIDSEYAEEIPIVGHSFADGKCGVCGYICPHNDMDVHYCNICGKTLECYDNDDHKCDYCGETLSECQDADNHKCDICQAVLSECADEDNDHACDICSKALSSCTDSDDDHVCDFCGEYSSDCSDSNDDERCDLCGAEAVTAVVKLYDSYGDGWNGSGIRVVRGDNVSRVISFDDGSSYEETFKLFKKGYSLKWKRGGFNGECSFEIIIDGVTVVTASEGSYADVADGYEILNTASLCEHKSEDGNHECDGCAKVLDCADENKDHICDFGNEELACADSDKNHFCDFGGEELSQCADEDDNHNCDICDAVLTGYTDADKNHECDICGEITVCIDEDTDSFCDICEKYLEDGARVELEYVDDYAYPDDYYNAFDGEKPEKLFDGDENSKLCIKFGTSTFSNGCDYYAVEFKTADDSEIYVSKYDFVTGNDAPERDPKSWKLYGSDDGESWTLIDERTDENITQSRNETVSYDVALGGKAYSYFKLEIHMVRQEYFFDEYGSFDDIPNAIFQLSEIALYKTHPHSWADGKCEICRIECEHKSNTDNICDTCGKSLHTCDFTGEWKYDSEKHWKECACGEIDGEAEHTFTDGKCDCGYECPHEETYYDIIRPVQNADGTWGKGTAQLICVVCGPLTPVEEVERNHEGYKLFDETAAKLELLLGRDDIIPTPKESMSNSLRGNRNAAYSRVYTDLDFEKEMLASMTKNVNDMLVELEARIADGMYIKADFSYLVSLLNEINALVDNNPENIISSFSVIYADAVNFYKNNSNNPGYNQNAYDYYVNSSDLENQLEKLIAGLKDGSALKADYTAIDEATAEIEEKLGDVELTDEAKAGLEEIKAKLEEMKADGNTSAADLAELEKALEDYETELDADIEDGSAVKVDGLEEIVNINDKLNNELAEKYGEEALAEIAEKLDEKFADKFDELYERAEALTGSVAENKDALAEIEAEMEAIFAEAENCLNGTHNDLKFEVTAEAKCGENAIESATCTLCGETVTREVENSALTHSFTKYEVTEEAKCGVAGKEVAYCDNGCGETDEKAIEALKHSFTKYEETEAPKCGVAGKEVAYCDNGCGETDEKEIEALTHSFTKYEVTEEAKCGVAGKKVAACDNGCGTTDEKEIDALEHIFRDYTYNDDATCEADGTKTAECIYGCGETDTVTVEGTMLEHADEDGDKICDDCEAEIKDKCPDCGGTVHEGPYGQYICLIRMLIKLVVSLVKALQAVV